ncbi:MAG: hypothetical protein ACR2OW_08460 [Methyloligellaceae bacterium]
MATNKSKLSLPIQALWSGDVNLNDTFFWFVVVWGTVVNIVTSVLFYIAVIYEWAAVWLVPLYFLPLPYNVWVTVGVWRSAARSKDTPVFAEIAKYATVLYMAFLSLT